MNNKKEKIERRLKGVVVSDKMDKTAVVLVSRTKKHIKYGKQYQSSKKYKVHDPKNECRIGDRVIFKAARPLSRQKRWKFVSKY